MIKDLVVAGAQLLGPPEEYWKGVAEFKYKDQTGSKAINLALYDEIPDAKTLLHQIDIEGIKKYSLGRMLVLLEEANDNGANLVVYPELSFTSFFPYFYIEEKEILDMFFQKESVENGVYTAPLLQRGKELGVSLAFGFAELVDDEYYNTMAFFDAKEDKTYLYRKTHIPGFRELKESRNFQFEQKYFRSSEEGYPVFEALGGKMGMLICHDRRYNNPYVIMEVRGVEMIINGYNTPFSLDFAEGEGKEKSNKYVYNLHKAPQIGQAITLGTYIVSVAVAGNVFGVQQIAGTCIISPWGELLAYTEQLTETLVYATINFLDCYHARTQKYHGERASISVLKNEIDLEVQKRKTQILKPT